MDAPRGGRKSERAANSWVSLRVVDAKRLPRRGLCSQWFPTGPVWILSCVRAGRRVSQAGGGVCRELACRYPKTAYTRSLVWAGFDGSAERSTRRLLVEPPVLGGRGRLHSPTHLSLGCPSSAGPCHCPGWRMGVSTSKNPRSWKNALSRRKKAARRCSLSMQSNAATL